jgi:hypothetical protein
MGGNALHARYGLVYLPFINRIIESPIFEPQSPIQFAI